MASAAKERRPISFVPAACACGIAMSAAAVMAWLPNPARSQATEGQVGLEGVIVTAQKREERLQDVPISITALTSEQLETRGIKSLDAFKHQWMLSPLGVPCNAPPWGTLLAIDLKAGKRLWEVPLGSTRELAPWPFWMKLGVPNVGGSVVTASGLTFIGASTDGYFRVFDVQTGEKLWEHYMGAGVQATPMTYRLGPKSRQYVVVAAGGHKYLRSRLGDAIVAFTLPD